MPLLARRPESPSSDFHDTPHGRVARRVVRLALGALVLAVAVPAVADPPGRMHGPDPALLAKTVNRGVEFLRTRGQAHDGSYSKFAGIGIWPVTPTCTMVPPGRVTWKAPCRALGAAEHSKAMSKYPLSAS